MTNELSHYGTKGMRWGIQKSKDSNSNKKHLGIDDSGNINLIKGKTTKKGLNRFAIKSIVFISAVGLASYVSKNPEIMKKGINTTQNLLSIHGKKSLPTISNDSGFYSKTLGRMLSVEEAITNGLL